MIQGIEHAALASLDPDSLAAWYIKTLDFVLEDHNAATRNFFIRSKDGSRIEIILAARSAGVPEMKDTGMRHMAIISDDFDADFARIKAAGAPLLTGAEIRGGNRVVFFRDPDGNVLHLIQRPIPLARP
ncbi:MAG: VOC family protein [Bryobacterales bacterium]|nr:VOC family protein [Bryobacterales bacterium]